MDPMLAVQRSVREDQGFVKFVSQAQPDARSLPSLVQTTLLKGGDERLKKKVRAILERATVHAGRYLTLHEWALGLCQMREDSQAGSSAARRASQVRACRQALEKIRSQVVLCPDVVAVLQTV